MLPSPPPTDFDAVFFDAGFTLLDPVESVADVYFERARRHAPDLDETAFRLRMEQTWPLLNANYRSKCPNLTSSEEIEREAWHDFTWEVAQPFASLVDRHEEWLFDLIRHFDHPGAWRPIAGATEALAHYASRGIPVAIVSNWHSALHSILEQHGLKQHCRFVLTSAEAGRKKPHREIFDLAVTRLGASASRVVHVGDSWEDDVQGARAAGLHAIHFRRDGKNSPETSRDREADVTTIESLAELLAL